MPISIARAQQEALNELGGFAEDKPGPIDLSITKKILAQYGQEFQLVIERITTERRIADSGDLSKKTTFQIVGDNTLQIMMPDYFDYPNKGVKGVKFNRNAPGSPYQFKNYGMSAEGRQKIRASIQHGKLQLRNIRNDKALGVGTERKRLSQAEATENTLIYMIKKYGIKATKYFDDTVKEVFKDVDVTFGAALAEDIVLNLKRKK